MAVIDAVVRAHGGEERLVHDLQGYGAVLCCACHWIARAALVHIDTAVYFVEAAEPWTPSAGGGWSKPVRPRIVLIATDGPELRAA
jgi:hypothetical protein